MTFWQLFYYGKLCRHSIPLNTLTFTRPPLLNIKKRFIRCTNSSFSTSPAVVVVLVPLSPSAWTVCSWSVIIERTQIRITRTVVGHRFPVILRHISRLNGVNEWTDGMRVNVHSGLNINQVVPWSNCGSARSASFLFCGDVDHMVSNDSCVTAFIMFAYQ